MIRPTLNRAKTDCWVHFGAYEHDVDGYFHHKGIGPKWAWATFFYNGEEYDGKIDRSKIIKSQRGQDLKGRYFARSPTGAIHLCRCRYTKAGLEAARREADKLLAGIRVE